MRIRQAKSIDALLDVADQETVSIRQLPAQSLDDFILRGVNVLILIDEHEAQLLTPFLSDLSGTICVRGPQQPQGVLFQVVKIHHPQLTFRKEELFAELLREPQQGQHLRPNPTPIFHERIPLFVPGRQRVKKLGFIFKIFQRLEPFVFLTPGTFLARGQNRFESSSSFCPSRIGR